MFQRSLFRIFGIPVRVDSSWLLIAGLVTWSLATGLFPARYPGLGTGIYWSMGILGAVGLFASILFHEVAHALVARGFGIQLRGLRLFIFGGVAEMTGESPSPRAEFLVAGVGPLSSFVLAGAAYGVLRLGDDLFARPLAGVLAYLAGINALLALFNLIPAFPLDGGRLLRAVLWARKGSMPWATRVTAGIGGGFGLLLIAFGVITMIRGGLIGGIWWILIGLFLRGAAGQASRQALVQRAMESGLRGTPIRRIMTPDPDTLAPEALVRDLMEEVVPRTRHEAYPVVSADGSLGWVSLDQIQEIPREKWDQIRVGEIAAPASDRNTVSADEDALAVFGRMVSSGASRLMVVDRGRLVGILTLRDLMGFVSSESGSART